MRGISDEIDYDELRRRVIEKTQRRYRFIAHTVVFVLAFPLLGSWGPLPLLAWILAWVFHLLWLSYQHSLEAAFHEAVQQEHERLSKLRRAELADPREEPYIVEDDDEHRAYRF